MCQLYMCVCLSFIMKDQELSNQQPPLLTQKAVLIVIEEEVAAVLKM